MDRRLFLTAIPATVAGCLSVGESTTPTQPKPPEGANEPPSFPDANEVRYPASGGGSILVTVDPSKPELPGANITFEVANHGNDQFTTNFYRWRLHKYVDGRWWNLGVFEYMDELHYLNGGETHTWEATVDNGQIDQLPEKLSPSADSSFTLAGVGSGTYAFSVVGSFEGDGSRFAAATPFQLEGENVTLKPTPFVETEHEGETVRVTYNDPSPNIGKEYELTARRRESHDEALTLVPEWGLRQEGIRNTLPLFSQDVEKVVYTTTGHPPGYAMDIIDGSIFDYRDYTIEFKLRKG